MIVIKKKAKPHYKFGGSSYGLHRTYRYGGSGIFSNIMGKKILKDGITKVINSSAKAKLGSKLVNAVVDGASNAVKNQTTKEIENLAANLINRKRKTNNATDSGDIEKYIANIPTIESIEHIIKGSGIVLD